MRAELYSFMHLPIPKQASRERGECGLPTSQIIFCTDRRRGAVNQKALFEHLKHYFVTHPNRAPTETFWMKLTMSPLRSMLRQGHFITLVLLSWAAVEVSFCALFDGLNLNVHSGRL